MDHPSAAAASVNSACAVANNLPPAPSFFRRRRFPRRSRPFFRLRRRQQFAARAVVFPPVGHSPAAAVRFSVCAVANNLPPELAVFPSVFPSSAAVQTSAAALCNLPPPSFFRRLNLLPSPPSFSPPSPSATFCRPRRSIRRRLNPLRRRRPNLRRRPPHFAAGVPCSAAVVLRSAAVVFPAVRTAARAVQTSAAVPRFAATPGVSPPGPLDIPPFAAALRILPPVLLPLPFAPSVLVFLPSVRPSGLPLAALASFAPPQGACQPQAAVTCLACAAHSTVRAVRVAPPPAARAPAASGCHLRCCGCAPRASRFERTWYCMLTQASTAHADASRPRAA